MPARPPLSRVGFNATLLSPSGDYRAAGIHRYVLGLLTSMPDALRETPGLTLTAFTAGQPAGAHLPDTLTVRHGPAIAARPIGRLLWEQLRLPSELSGVGATLLHGPAYAMPLACPVPAVVTVHDLSFFRLPATLPRLKGAYLRAATRHAVRRAAALIAVSGFTRDELVTLLGADPARVHVVPNGVDQRCRPLETVDIERYRRREGLPARFVLSVGTLQPRKNLGILVEAMARLRAQIGTCPPLVIAGAPGWGDTALGVRARALGVADDVRLLGYVPGEDLPALYNAATVFAFPSRYEGFGLPVAEAMACGTPVVVSDAASLPEVAGPAGLTVDPDDVDGWAAALGTLLADPERRAALAARGRAQAARFSWPRTARATLAVYRHALEAVGATAEVPDGAR